MRVQNRLDRFHLVRTSSTGSRSSARPATTSSRRWPTSSSSTSSTSTSTARTCPRSADWTWRPAGTHDEHESTTTTHADRLDKNAASLTRARRLEVAADGRGREATGESSPDGLSQAEAAKRLAQYGPNEIAEHKTNPLLKFLSYFWGPIPWMIEVAVILSGAVGHWPDFFIILVLLVANAVVGFWEERQAGNAIDALKAKLAIKPASSATANGSLPPARELVPGRRHPAAAGRHRPGRRPAAGRRRDRGRPVRADRRVAARHPQARRRGVLRIDHPPGEIGALVYATGTNTYFGKTANWCRTRTPSATSRRPC
jgi:hypothetical protein